MRGRQHAGVHRDDLVAAEPLDAALLENPKEFCLGIRRKIPDFIQENGAPLGLARSGRCAAPEPR